jgi:hypothetical protein
MKNIFRVFIRISSSFKKNDSYSLHFRNGLSIHRFFQTREQKQEGLNMSEKNIGGRIRYFSR